MSKTLKENKWVQVLGVLEERFGEEDNIALKANSQIGLLIAIILSARSRDVFVNRFCKAITHATEEELFALSLEEIEEMVKSITFFRNKSKTILELIKRYQEDKGILYKREELAKIKGIGRKTLNVFLNVVTDESFVGVDVHVHRVFNRLNGTEFNNAKVEEELVNNLEDKDIGRVNKLFVLHGRNICRPKPLCDNCPIRNECLWYQKNKK